jgi:hypothetical protein
MKNFKQSKKPNLDAINLLVSILVCFPEIGTVSFEPEDDSLNLTFVLDKVPKPDELAATQEFIKDSIMTYHLLEGFSQAKIAIHLDAEDEISFLHIVRDVVTLSQGEISLISTLMREHYGQVLISDVNRDTLEEAEVVREEVIDHMIGSMKINHVAERMIGIREEGRVMVFNK